MGLKEEEREREEIFVRWQAKKKPAHLLELKGRDDFKALFDEEGLASYEAHINVRWCWRNEAPALPTDRVPLLMWHPMIHVSLSEGLLWSLIEEALRGFAVIEAWYWQCEVTRWVFLTLKPPNDDDDDRPYVSTSWFFRFHYDEDGVLVRTFEGAS